MHCHPPELQLATTPWREHSEVSTVQYVLVLGLVVTARSVPHILLAWAISSLHWLVLTIFQVSPFDSTQSGTRVIWQDHAPDNILFCVPSVYSQFCIDLRKRSVTKSVHADASVLGKHPGPTWRELDSGGRSRNRRIFKGIYVISLAIDNAFGPVVKYLVEPLDVHSLFDSIRLLRQLASRSRAAQPRTHGCLFVDVGAFWDTFSPCLNQTINPFRWLASASSKARGRCPSFFQWRLLRRADQTPKNGQGGSGPALSDTSTSLKPDRQPPNVPAVPTAGLPCTCSHAAEHCIRRPGKPKPSTPLLLDGSQPAAAEGLKTRRNTFTMPPAPRFGSLVWGHQQRHKQNPQLQDMTTTSSSSRLLHLPHPPDLLRAAGTLHIRRRPNPKLHSCNVWHKRNLCEC